MLNYHKGFWIVLESKLKLKCKKIAKKYGFTEIKIDYDGWPDRIFFGNSVSIYVEFKRSDKEKLRPKQEVRREQLLKGCQLYYLVSSIEDFIRIMKVHSANIIECD